MIIACDPGREGAIVVLANGGVLLEALFMPEILTMSGLPNTVKLADEINSWINKYGKIDRLAIEQIRAINKGGRKLMPYRLIGSAHTVMAVSESLGIVPIEIAPQTWQKFAYGRNNAGNKRLAAAWCQQKGYDMNKFHTLNGKISYDACEAVIIGRAYLASI